MITNVKFQCSKTGNSTETTESSGISVSDNEADTLSGSLAEEESQEQSTEGAPEAGRNDGNAGTSNTGFNRSFFAGKNLWPDAAPEG